MGRKPLDEFGHTWINYMHGGWMKKCFDLEGHTTFKLGALFWLVYSWQFRKKEPERRVVEIHDRLIRYFGISARSRYRGMKRMEEADLIQIVKYGPGLTPTVRLKFTKTSKVDFNDEQ